MQITNIAATIAGDSVILTGLVEGRPRSVHVWKSHLDSLADDAARIAYVLGELAAEDARQPKPLDLGFTSLNVSLPEA